MPQFIAVLTLALVSLSGAVPQHAPATDVRARAAALAALVRRADYENDRAGLAGLHAELGALAADGGVGSRVHYWMGFALWRRAINGFNDTVPPAELAQDLNGALRDFSRSLALDPSFAEARVGTISCIGYLGFLSRSSPEELKNLFARFQAERTAAMNAAAENPRLIWALGPSDWYSPTGTPAAQVLARQTAAIANYERGLELIRRQPRMFDDPLAPTWGEPELLMNLAWSNLHRTTPDITTAEKQAREALALVPYWHYVRDILLPQILAAKGKAPSFAGGQPTARMGSRRRSGRT